MSIQPVFFTLYFKLKHRVDQTWTVFLKKCLSDSGRALWLNTSIHFSEDVGPEQFGNGF